MFDPTSPVNDPVMRLSQFVGALDYLLRQAIAYLDNSPCPCGQQAFAQTLKEYREKVYRDAGLTPGPA